MNSFFIYKESTGEIVSVGSRPDDDFEHVYVQDGCRLAVGAATKKYHRYDLIANAIVELPPKPKGVATFNYTTLEWEVDAVETVRKSRELEYPSIGDQLDALWKLIKANADKIDLTEAAPLLEAVQAVKDKYLKPPTNDIN